jgi:hypothetical protein
MSKECLALFYEKVIKETDSACLLSFGTLEQWVPKSLIDPDYLPLEEDGGEVKIERWFCEENELEDFEDV